MKKTVLASSLAAILGPALSSEACPIIPQGKCYIIELDLYTPATQFFRTAAAQTTRASICAAAQVKGRPGFRMYINGQRIEKEKGCLTQAEVKRLKDDYQLKYDCSVYTCDEL